MTDALARQIARFAAELRYDDLPAVVVDKAKACILHNLGVALAGHSSGAVQVARATVLAAEQVTAGGATILVDGTKATAYGAAFVNSALMHAKLQEDACHTGSHPGTMIIPAALAAAEARRRSGRDLITAIVAGYEVEAALTAGFIPRSNARGFRSSPIYGPFGAAVAAGSLIGLSIDQYVQAIGYAATFAAGTFEGGAGSNVSVLQVAQAPRSGLLAAFLAEHGGLASETSLEGQIGFYYAFTGGTEGLEHLADHLGQRWEILEVTLKRYPTAMFNQPPIHVMLTLTERHNLVPAAIASILVEMNDFETSYPGPMFPAPDVGAARRFGSGTTNFVVAATCVNRGFVLPPDRSAGWNSPIQGIERLPSHAEAQRLAERVTVVGSPEIPPLAPRLSVRRHDGTEHQLQATGDEFKLGLEEDKEIVRALVPEMPFNAEEVERLIEAVERLDAAPTVAGLLNTAIRAPRAAG